MSKAIVTFLITAAMVSVAVCGGQADDPADVPDVTIELAVLTADGSARTFQVPGSAPAEWDRTFPVVKGDRAMIGVTVNAGEAELREFRIRLDNKVLPTDVSKPSQVETDTEPPEWLIEIDTAELDTGHHLIEAWAATNRPDRYKSVTTSFLLVPPSDPLLLLLSPDAYWLQRPPPDRTVSDEEGLACTIRSLDPKVDEELKEASSATVTEPVYFRVLTGPSAKRFFYTISRDHAVTYASQDLPLLTHIRLGPPTAEAPGLEPGDLILTVRAVDGKGRVGPPHSVTVRIKAGEEAGK